MPSSQRRTLLKPTVCLLLMRRCTSRPQPSQTQHAINEWRGHPDGQADVMGNCQQCVKLDRIVPFHILQHGHLERAEARIIPIIFSMEVLAGVLACIPSAAPIRAASSIIETQSRRTSGSSMIRSEVAEVSKLIGFMLRLPHNLNQMSCWILGLSRQSKSARRSQSARRASRGVGRLSGSPTRSWRRMMPGSSTEAAMCKTQPSTRLVGMA